MWVNDDRGARFTAACKLCGHFLRTIDIAGMVDLLYSKYVIRNLK